MPCFADFYFDTRSFPTRQLDDDPIKHLRERERERERESALNART